MSVDASLPEVDCTCPVCYDVFKDPVLLLCSHSFCKYCLQEWLKKSEQQTCPVCKEVFPVAQPPSSLALRDVSDALREERSQRANSKEICSLHNEELKLFCQDDKQLICVICQDSQKHKNHNFVPVNEAAEAQRTQLKVPLMTLKSTVGSFERAKLDFDIMASHITLQAQKTEKAIKEDFQKLYQFLRAEEAARIDAVRREATLKSEAMNIKIVNLTTEISSLTDRIQTIEKEMRADDISFIQNVKSTIDRSQYNWSQPETPSGALINESKHVGNLLFTVWTKMKTIIQYTPVTLDPNTFGWGQTISEHMTRSTTSDQRAPLPSIPERMWGIEGFSSEGFSSGKHSWDVEVGGFWGVGMAAKTNNKLDRKIWSIYMCGCTNILREQTPQDYVKVVSEDSFPERVRVELDYNRGILSFFDLDKKTLVHKIKYTFVEMVFAYFRGNAKILPAEVKVQIGHPR